MKLELTKLILASGSPRRAEILNAVGWKFDKIVADVDETEFDGENPSDYVMRLAKTKAEVIAANHKNATVLGADTTVVIDNQILGKPLDFDDARRMLQMLSGKTHEVLTGVAVVKNGETHVGIQSTKVKFVTLSDAEIEYLVEFGEPLDKAGGYAVQAQAALFIEEIEGDYWNVVGLPISLVYSLIKTNLQG
jgi:septum formation protein